MYWMWRDRRVQDNWALLYSQKQAIKHNVPLKVAVMTSALNEFVEFSKISNQTPDMNAPPLTFFLKFQILLLHLKKLNKMMTSL